MTKPRYFSFLYEERFLPFLMIIVLPLLYQQVNAQSVSMPVGRSVVNSKGVFKEQPAGIITPNDFKGTDIERIRAAISAAQGTTNEVVIPRENANGTSIWKIDSAILLPSNMTVILNNCVVQLSDKCRDNMFRSRNVGIGITDPSWCYNIAIIGVGNVLLKGADNPRATGDGNRTLVKTPQKGRVSYGSDAGKQGAKQTGDWRNYMIVMAYVNGFKLKNVTIQNSHAWAVDCERVRYAEISDIRFYNPRFIKGIKVGIANKDGIDLRYGCKYFRIDNITGMTGDDLIALSSLDVGLNRYTNGDINSFQVTSTKYRGAEDDIEQIFITNCKASYGGVAIRASGSAGIHDVYINGLISKLRAKRSSKPVIPPLPPYNSRYTLVVGQRDWGEKSLPGKIHDIYAMNLIGDGDNLIVIESPIAHCVFMNGIYTGTAASAITYNIDKIRTKDITEVNLVKAATE